MIVPKIFSKNVIAAQSTRKGGVSKAPFSTLNLGLSVKDDEVNVLRNRLRFFGGLGIEKEKLALSHQVHGNKVLVVTEPGRKEGYDAQITNIQGLYLAVSIADCTPILIHDEKHNVVAAIHAGWKGTAGKVVSNALHEMQHQFGTKGNDCKAFIGACISYKSFEVDEDVAEYFSQQHKRFDDTKKKWFVDLKSVNRQQLIEFGLLPENIEVSEYCTVANNDLFFSHRFEKGNTGRMMAVIGVK